MTVREVGAKLLADTAAEVLAHYRVHASKAVKGQVKQIMDLPARDRLEVITYMLIGVMRDQARRNDTDEAMQSMVEMALSQGETRQ